MKKLLFILLLLLSICALISCGECEHQWSEATCSTPKTCTLCEETQGNVLEHNFTEWETTKDPTCTIDGELTRTCECGKTEYSTVTASHETVTHEGKSATCISSGYKEYITCTKCAYTTYEAIPILPHDTIIHNGQAPTCQSIGYLEYETCQNCNYTTYQEISVLSHDTVTYPAKAPTCTEIGYDAYEKCKNCDYSTYKEKAMLKHKYVSTVTPPTCEGEGYTTYVCSECGDTYISNKVAPHGHTWGEWFISSIPDEKNDGQKRQNCVNCRGCCGGGRRFLNVSRQ